MTPKLKPEHIYQFPDEKREVTLPTKEELKERERWVLAALENPTKEISLEELKKGIDGDNR